MVHRAGVGEAYTVQLVGFNGTGGPYSKPVSRSDKTVLLSTPCPPNAMCPSAETANYELPETSVSSTHVYFLDGEIQVDAMGVDGKVTPVRSIAAPPNSQVTFAVSPDDSRIAVAIITLASEPNPAASFSDHMYVEDLRTTAHRVDLYSSTSQAEWPIGWHAGALVVAVGSMDGPELGNPYGATGYALVDPAAGRTILTFDCVQGLAVAAGNVCVKGGCPKPTECTDATLHLEAWDGTERELALPPGAARHIVTGWSYTELSPDGKRVAAELVTDPATGATETAVIQDGSIVYTTEAGAPEGWLDADHLVVQNADQVTIVNVVTGDVVEMLKLEKIPRAGTPSFVGTMPEELG
jgi:hypothetical protein